MLDDQQDLKDQPLRDDIRLLGRRAAHGVATATQAAPCVSTYNAYRE